MISIVVKLLVVFIIGVCALIVAIEYAITIPEKKRTYSEVKASYRSVFGMYEEMKAAKTALYDAWKIVFFCALLIVSCAAGIHSLITTLIDQL